LVLGGCARSACSRFLFLEFFAHSSGFSFCPFCAIMHSLAILSLFAFCAVSMAIMLPLDSSKISPDHFDLALMNVSSAAASTKMDAATLKLDDAAKSAEKVKGATIAAEKAKAISSEDAAKIKAEADNVQRAATTGDHTAVLEHVDKMNDHIDNAIGAKKPEAFEKLKKADKIEDMPVLSTKEDEKLLRSAVEKVVAADPLIPAEKKQEATNFTVTMIKEGFKNGDTTNKQLVTNVEMLAAKNKTGTDRDFEGERWRRCCHHRWFEEGCTEWEHRRCEELERGHGRFSRSPAYGAPLGNPNLDIPAPVASPSFASPVAVVNPVVVASPVAYESVAYAAPAYESVAYAAPVYSAPAYDTSASYAAPAYDTGAGFGGSGYGGYNPTYSYGYGYDQCLYWSPYSYCRERLFGDYAFHHGFHHFFHNHGRGGRGGHGGRGGNHGGNHGNHGGNHGNHGHHGSHHGGNGRR